MVFSSLLFIYKYSSFSQPPLLITYAQPCCRVSAANDRIFHGGSSSAGGAAACDNAPSGGNCWDRLSPNDLGMRSDTLISPRVSPVMAHRRVPSLVVTSSLDKSGRWRLPMREIIMAAVELRVYQNIGLLALFSWVFVHQLSADVAPKLCHYHFASDSMSY